MRLRPSYLSRKRSRQPEASRCSRVRFCPASAQVDWVKARRLSVLGAALSGLPGVDSQPNPPRLCPNAVCSCVEVPQPGILVFLFDAGFPTLLPLFVRKVPPWTYLPHSVNNAYN